MPNLMPFVLKESIFGMKIYKPYFSWLVVRIPFFLFLVPEYQFVFFQPFIQKAHLSFFDPWSNWLFLNGRTDAFPYGPTMYLFFLPSILLTIVFKNINVHDFITISSYLTVLQVLFLDFLLNRHIRSFDNFKSVWAKSAILSPILIYVSLIQGQLDLVPTLFFAFAITYLISNKWYLVGIFVGLSISTKFSFLLIVPFILIYILKIHSRKYLKEFLFGVLPFAIWILAPALYSYGYRQMTLTTPEVLRLFDLSVKFAKFELYLVPIIYILLLYWLWSLPRVNSKMLASLMGAALISISIGQIESLGWLVWSIPAIYVIVKNSSKTIVNLFLIWQISVVISYAYHVSNVTTRYGNSISWSTNKLTLNLLFSLTIIVTSVFVIKFLKETSSQCDPLDLNRKPLSIAIAGDSGTGKDTLANGLGNIFDTERTMYLMGDDYHLHERSDNSWKQISHLNLSGNDLSLMSSHFSKAIKRLDVTARRYDHESGKFTEPRIIEKGDLVVLNGLHSLQMSSNERPDLRVFLEMQEELRINLKIRRDSSSRNQVIDKNYLATLENRKLDYTKFVEPQRNIADLICRVFAVDSELQVTNIQFQSKNGLLMEDILTKFNTKFGEGAVKAFDRELSAWYIFKTQELSSQNNFDFLVDLIPEIKDLIPEIHLNSIMPGTVGFSTVVTFMHLISIRINQK